LRLHAGSAELPIDPPIVVIDPRGSRNLDITVRNHSNEIRTFTIAAEGTSLEFSPPKIDISIGAVMERVVSLRVFAQAPGLHQARLRMSGGSDEDLPVRLLAVPRNQSVEWHADLDGDGVNERVLENYRARAVFSTTAGRWLEFVWKDTGTNVLPETGLLVSPERAKMHPTDARVTIEQSAPAPAIPAATIGTLRFQSSGGVYTIQPVR
jgi:hypothetical protein